MSGEQEDAENNGSINDNGSGGGPRQRRASNASVISDPNSPITIPETLRASLRRSSVQSSPRRRPSLRASSSLRNSESANDINLNSISNSNNSNSTGSNESTNSGSASVPSSPRQTPSSSVTRARTDDLFGSPRRPNKHIHGRPQAQLANFAEQHFRRNNIDPNLRRFSDSYIDFRPAAARAGLYPNRRPRPLHIHHESALKSLGQYLKNKTKFFWHGQSRYAKIHFFTYFLLGFIGGFIIWGVEHENTNFIDSLFFSVSMLTGTGLTTIDFGKVHFFTKVFAVLLMFGGSPLTVVLPITLVIRRHCSGTKPKRALLRLFNICLTYYILFIVLPFLVYGFYLNAKWSDRLDGNNPFFFALVHSVSAFTNGGISLLADNMIRFATDYLMNLLTAFQIIFGYMAIPLALRFAIWVSQFVPGIDSKPSRMLLKTPAFAGYLFPRVETQIITIVLVGIIFVGTISNVAVEWNQSLRQFDPAHKFLAAFFNDVTTRNAGLNTIDFSKNYEVTNLIAIFWMYIAGYPVGVRVSRNLQPHMLGEVVGFYVRKFLISGKWWIAICLVIICLVERQRLLTDPNFTFFKVLFEVISGYGTVGLTLGYPNAPYSFSGEWRNLSKLCLVFIMFIGRHRRLKGTLLNSVYEANMIGNPFGELSARQGTQQAQMEEALEGQAQNDIGEEEYQE